MATSAKNLSKYDENTIPSGEELTFGIVVSEWNADITHALYEACYDTLIKHGAKPEELVTDPEARTETAPDWVQQAQTAKEQEGIEEPVAEEQLPAAVEEPVEPVQEATAAADLSDSLAEEGEPAGEPDVKFDAVDTGELGTSAEEQDDAVAWLEGLASKHGAKPEELVTDPEARTETAPDWVQKAAETGTEEAPVEEVKEVVVEVKQETPSDEGAAS